MPNDSLADLELQPELTQLTELEQIFHTNESRLPQHISGVELQEIIADLIDEQSEHDREVLREQFHTFLHGMIERNMSRGKRVIWLNSLRSWRNYLIWWQN